MLTLWGFVWRCCKSAAGKSWGHYDHLTNAATIAQFLSLLGFVAIWIGRHLHGADMNFWFLALPVGVAVLSFLAHLPISAHDIYKETVNSAAQEKQALITQITERNNAIGELTAALKTATDETERLAKERFKRMAARQAMGNCLLNLQSRLETVRRINSFSYTQEVHEKEIQQTVEVINETYEALERFCDTAAAASFRSAKAEPLPPIQNYEQFTMRQEEKQHHMRILDAHIAELKKIIDRYPPFD